MPTYDFKCLDCNHEFTVLVSIKEKENVRCPMCGSEKKSQQYGGAGITVKNSGDSCFGCGSNSGGFG